MVAELGVIFLIVALLAAAVQSAYLLRHVRVVVMPCMGTAAWLQALAVTMALATLIMLRVDSDFSVANVVAHSNLSLPMLYKIAGAWGNHEGSMLLWVWVLATFGTVLALRTSEDVPMAFSAVAVQSCLSIGTILFVLFTSNPFARMFPPAADGQALNPVLQDVALAIHPPLLYVGYVGFSIVFSLAVAALLTGRADRAWAEMVHPWILASWSALTLGIGLGSWWAYRELGWGGWWFWDPVENASLLPWLAGTALLHSNSVLKKRGALAQWVVLLAILTFALSLIGTFLVRSGALTSVHSFASDPARGVFILVFIIISVGGALLLFALHGGRLRSQENIQPVSREGMIVLNNLFLLSTCATVLLGTLYPLVSEWLQGNKLTVGPPYFNATFLPMMALPVLFAGLAPFMAWKNASFRQAWKQAVPAALAAGAVLLLVLAVVKTHLLFAVMGFGLAAWLAASSVVYWLRSRGRDILALCTAHLGAAVLMAGITGAGLWKTETEHWAKKGDALEIGGYGLTYEGSTTTRRENHDVRQGSLTLTYAGQDVGMLKPEYRIYDIKGSRTSEAAIYSTWRGDIYAVMGETVGGRDSLRLYFVPMIDFIWAGCMLMALGGVIAILQKRVYNRGKHTIQRTA